MWTKAFWQATAERMVRGAAVAVAAAYFAGDVVFDAMHVSTWNDVLSLAVGGAFGSLVLALAGNAMNGGNGPALNSAENVQPQHRA